MKGKKHLFLAPICCGCSGGLCVEVVLKIPLLPSAVEFCVARISCLHLGLFF